MGERKWADTKLMCMPGNNTMPGSRNLTEALKSSSPALIPGLSGRMISIAFVSSVLSVFW